MRQTSSVLLLPLLLTGCASTPTLQPPAADSSAPAEETTEIAPSERSDDSQADTTSDADLTTTYSERITYFVPGSTDESFQLGLTIEDGVVTELKMNPAGAGIVAIQKIAETESAAQELYVGESVDAFSEEVAVSGASYTSLALNEALQAYRDSL